MQETQAQKEDQRRYELAKELFIYLFQKAPETLIPEGTSQAAVRKAVARVSVDYADALIAELRL